MRREEILKKVKNNVHLIYPSAIVILYGSRARGDYNEYSDWDILILLNKKITFFQKLAINDLLFNIELEINEVLIPIIHNIEEWNDLEATAFYQNIQREGIKL